MDVVVGTYSSALIGFTFMMKEQEEPWIFRPKFTDQGHDGCVKAVAICEKYLASGSTDENIRLFDIKRNIDLGYLVQQSGTITDLQFSGSSHLLSASEDGTICVWKCKSWECIKTLKGHRGAINSISIHPSGRLVLSVSRDKTVRTWNLLNGRSAYTTNIKHVGELVAWSPNGDSYAIACGTSVAIYSISESKETCRICCSNAVLSMDFISEDVILLGGELKETMIYDIKQKNTLQTFSAHENRVKSLKSVQHPCDVNSLILFSVSSDGKLKAWSLNRTDIQKSPQLLAEILVPGRPVCMTVAARMPEHD